MGKKEKGKCEWGRKTWEVVGAGNEAQQRKEAAQVLPLIPELFSQMKTSPSVTREEESSGWSTRAATATAPSSTSPSSQLPTWTKSAWPLGTYARVCFCCSVQEVALALRDTAALEGGPRSP